MNTFQKLIRYNPIIYNPIHFLLGIFKPNRFNGSADYWERRYVTGNNSGYGSYGILMDYKAGFVNNFIVENKIESVIDFGCGDGSSSRNISCKKYIGLDVSETIVENQKSANFFKDDKSFYLYPSDKTAELGISMDVIYHLVEREVFEEYLGNLFKGSTKYVIIYSSNEYKKPIYAVPHIRHRKFSDWIENNIDGWKLKKVIKNKFPRANTIKTDDECRSFSDFFVYEKDSQSNSNVKGGKNGKEKI